MNDHSYAAAGDDDAYTDLRIVVVARWKMYLLAREVVGHAFREDGPKYLGYRINAIKDMFIDFIDPRS